MRRRLLGPKRLALLCGLILFMGVPQSEHPSFAATRASGVVVANEVTQLAPASNGGQLARPVTILGSADTGSTEAPTLVVTSDVVDSGQLFDRVGLHWIAERDTQDTIFFELRTSADARQWSDWVQRRPDEDMAALDRNEWYAPPLAVEAARYAQYRVWLTAGDPSALVRVGLTFMDVDDLNAGPVARLLNDVRGALADMTAPYSLAAAGAPKILTRQDWGADESLMKWTPQYQKPHTKAIVHHTVTDDGGSNVASTIRGIYYYHAVTRGWGDIGYNYLVDKFGNIWTGRQGGDHTTGGHAYGWNNGAFGVAAIGDYSVAQPTGQLQGAIANIIALKFAQYGVQPFGNDPFTHQEQRTDGTWVDVASNPPNLQGHRDSNYVVGQSGGQTGCPGAGIYNMLPGLRALAQNAVIQGYTNLVRIEPGLAHGTYPGATSSVPVSITNRGTTPIPASTAVSYRMLRDGVVVTPQGTAAVLQAPLAPGATTVVTIPFSAPAQGSYVVRWDLQTAGVWWNQLYGTPYRESWLRSTDWSADWQDDNIPNSFVAGEVKLIKVIVANDGGRTWNAGGVNPVQFSYTWTSTSTGNRFPGLTKLPLPFDVQPGQTITVNIPVVAPLYPTNYTLTLDLEKTNEFRFGDRGIAVDDTSIAVLVNYSATYAVTMPQAPVAANATLNVPVTVTNTGRGVLPTTSGTPISLGYHWYDAAGKAVVYDSPRTKLPADLAPGASVALTAQVQAPPNGGTFRLTFDLVQEGVAWFSTKGVLTPSFPVTVNGPLIKSYGASYVPQATTLAMSGAQSAVPIQIGNSGNFAWPSGGANPVTLSYHWWSLSENRTAVWDGLRTKLPADVGVGGTATLQAQVRFPQYPGNYLLRWDLVEEGVLWFSGKGVATFDQLVKVSPFVAPFYGGSIDASRTPSTLPTRMTSAVTMRVQNLSNFDFDGTVNLSYHWYDASGRAAVWDGKRTSLGGLRIGEVRQLTASVAGPPAPGAWTLRWDIVREGVSWFSDQGMQLPAVAIDVAVPQYGALYEVPASAAGPSGTVLQIPVTVTNTGSLQWQGGLFNLSYHLIAADGTVVAWDGLRSALPGIVAPGQSVALNALVRAPLSGVYTVRFDLVQEGVSWFSGKDVPIGVAILTSQ
ncbi:MAG: N-acetylmuramoyl-L-alanine amidase [Chloroflexi bacterium]|nr:N-acetylmuramoyl-L-alanine amidase [Chloroflexota bacterium]